MRFDNEVQFAGTKIHYLEWNGTSGKHVLLVHGLTSNSHAWVKLGDRLSSEGFHVIAPDLRGRGLSVGPPHGYGVPFHSADLLSLSDASGLEKFSIVGHSLGGIIGLYMTALYPDRVEKFTLVDVGIRLPPDTIQAISASLNRLGQVFPSLDAYLDMARKIPYYAWNEFWDQYYRYDAMVRSDGTVISRVSKSAIQEELATNATLNEEVLPPLIRVPTLILKAARGTLGPDSGLLLTREEATRLSGMIKGSEIKEISGTNHYTIITSEDFEKEVSVFLQK
ncbi:MAG TPA: alpha/beta hydrolase [Nitrososphaerales archaeon]|nr:alpha/beta hydrolase [Nitrososphaerales archaeon]